MKPLCIYHGNCADGFTAAWAVWKALGADNVDFHAGVYQDPPPNVKRRDVILVDFSYKREVLEKMAGQARSLLILDHHKSAAEDLKDLPPAEAGLTYGGWINPAIDRPQYNVAAIFDLERSGARIAWDFFHPGKLVPTLVQYVEDRDLWRFALPNSRGVNANIFSYAYSFETWEQMFWDLQNGVLLRNFMQAGNAIERKHHKDVAELVATTRRRMKIGEHEVWVANIPYTLTSDAGHLMAKGAPFAACYWDTPEGRVFSLRSTDEGLDVSEVAKQFGGGGHKHAAGFRVPFAKLGALA